MPVFTEIVHQPSEQDQRDLRLIYACDDTLPTWLQSALAGEGLLIAGRFNGRLLGAFYLQEGSDSHQLLHLQVRDITRRRSVARQLLHLALRKLPPEITRIQVDLAKHPELKALFAEQGFNETDSGSDTNSNTMVWTRG